MINQNNILGGVTLPQPEGLWNQSDPGMGRGQGQTSSTSVPPQQPYGQFANLEEGEFAQFDPNRHRLNTQYLQEQRDIAFGDPGSSPWLGYQMEQDKYRQQSDMDALQAQGASSMATQQGNLAMRGGLTSGASERMGQQNIMGSLMGNQQLSRSAAAREAGYRQQAEERQRAVLMGLGNQELAAAGYTRDMDQFAIQEHNKTEAARRLAENMRNQQSGGYGQGYGSGEYSSYIEDMKPGGGALSETPWTSALEAQARPLINVAEGNNPTSGMAPSLNDLKPKW